MDVLKGSKKEDEKQDEGGTLVWEWGWRMPCAYSQVETQEVFFIFDFKFFFHQELFFKVLV